MNQFSKRGMLYAVERHIHLAERDLEGSTLRFYRVEVLSKSRTFFTLDLKTLDLGKIRHKGSSGKSPFRDL